MTWFVIALLVALGGIFAAWTRAKGTPNPIVKKPDDGPHINLNDAKDVERWTKELGVDKWDLEDAVRDHGTSAEAVRKNLKGK